MRQLKTIVKYEWIALWQSSLFSWSLGTLTFFATYALYYGHASISKQMRTIGVINQANDSTKAIVYNAFEDPALSDSLRFGWAGMNGIGDALTTEDFLANNVAINYPNRLSHLAIGQRDVYPIYRKVSARSLYNDTGSGVSLDEKYVETSNPHKLLAGNFDLSYVFLFLFPLFIIAFTFNIVSQEVENGTYPLIRILPISTTLFFATKFFFRFAVLVGFAILFSLAGFLFSPLDAPVELSLYFDWLALIAAYILFWFSLAWAVVSLRQNSPTNALLLVGLWLLFLVIIPASINNYVAANFSIDSRTVLVDKINDQSGKIWDMPESIWVESYYLTYPAYRQPESSKLWFTAEDSYDDLGLDESLDLRYNKKILIWHYYLDKIIAHELESYNRQLESKQQASHRFSFINPAGVTYEKLCALAASGHDHQNRFRAATARYQNNVFERTNKFLFEEQKLSLEDYKGYPAFDIDRFSSRSPRESGVVLYLTLAAVLSIAIGLLIKKY